MNWLGQWNTITGGVRGRWAALPSAQRRVVLLSLLAFAVFGGVSAWWSTRTDWRVLFRDLDGRDTAQVQQELASAAIPFQTTSDGIAVEVAAEDLDKARVAIAAKGMPQSGRMGFELFDKPNWAGSEFDEKVNYQRALEGELEHTISSMDAVRSARVHLVLPQHGAFMSEDRPAKASVVLTLRRTMDARTDGAALRALVAGAVEGLSADAVALVDADGRVNFSAAQLGGSSSREEESALQQKLIAVLEPLAGAGNVRATVNISYLTSSEERTDEVYDPNSAVPVSTERTEQTSQALRNGGIAGTASNTPALAPVSPASGGSGAAGSSPAAPQAVTATASSSGPTQSSREESNSFVVNRHSVHSAEGPGRIRRIAAAVVINDRAVISSEKKTSHTTWKPRTPDEMKRLQQIAQAAVGFDSARGDEVVVQNFAFSSNADEPTTAGFLSIAEQARNLLRNQPSLLRSIVMGGTLLALGFLVLRPLGRQTVAALALPESGARIQDAQLVLRPEEAVSETASSVNTAAPDAHRLLQQVAARIQAEPQGSSRLVESWINAGEVEL